MHETIQKMVQVFAKQREQRRRACAAFTALAILVSVSTTWLLVQPANTLAAEYVCGMEEHVHTDECYAWICGDEAEEAPGMPEADGETVEDEAPVEEPAGEESPGEAPDGENPTAPEAAAPVAPEASQPADPEPVAPEVSQPAGPEPVAPEVRQPAHPEPAAPEVSQPAAPEPAAPETAEPVSQPIESTPAPEPASEAGDETMSGKSLDMAMVMYTNKSGETESEPASDPAPAPVEESKAEEPAVEEPVKETPVQEEPKAEGPVVEEPVVEESAGENSDGEPADREEPAVDGGPVVEESSGSHGHEHAKEGHVHTSACRRGKLICGKEEHVHSEACYKLEEELELICTIPEHIHSADCFGEAELICVDETEGHQHDESCYGEATLVCGLEEHIHGDACYAVKQGDLLIVLPEGAEIPEGYDEKYTYIDPDNRYGVAVYAEPETFPEGAQLVADLMEEGSDSYEETSAVLEELVHRGEASYDEFVALDVHFLLDGEEVQPASPVYVCVNVVGLFSERIDPTSISVHHFAENSEEAVEAAADEVVEAPAEETAMEEPATEEPAGSPVEEPAETVVEEPAATAPASVVVGDVLVETVADSSEETGQVEGIKDREDTVDTVAAAFDLTGFSPMVFLANNDIQFTVQHYAYITELAASGNTALPVIDTSDGANAGSGPVLPRNGTTPVTKNIYLNANGVVATTTTLKKMYADNNYMYSDKLSSGNTQAQNLAAINKLSQNTNYTPSAVWKLLPGKSADSTNQADWKVYDPATVTFVKEGVESDTVIVLTNDTVLRMVYTLGTGSYSNDAAFYDYDISSSVSGNTMYTKQGGINSNGNNLAFGNANTGTGLETRKVGDSLINQYNGSKGTSGYRGCSFGLVSSLGADGQINYASGVTAPNMFNDGTANGKTSYTGTKMNFNRVGDAYELISVSGSDNISVSGLNTFANPSNSAGNHTTIWTNDFWPMDGVRNGDIHFGDSASYTNNTKKYSGANSATGPLPESDDGLAHNSYFGLNYAVQFELTSDYVGPLDYVFFGDDDMWVFLSKVDASGNMGAGQLVCDIGGVHSSVGEYVNLWDYIQGGANSHEDGTYILSFFYTERGASGSTCYMRFTLPSVSSVPPDLSTGTLEISKEVVGATGYTGDFDFTIYFKGANGKELDDLIDHNAIHSELGVISVKSGDTIQLGDGDSIQIVELPVGTEYTVTEAQVDGFRPSYQIRGVVTESNTASGNIPAGNVAIKFINTTGPVLPSTGGMGTNVFTTLGTVMMLGAGVLLDQRRRKLSAC